MANKVLGVLSLLLVLSLISCQQSSDSGARISDDEPESSQVSTIKVTLPPSPDFNKDHPAERYPDQAYSVYGLRKNLKTLLNQQVRVMGYLLEVYECPACKGKDCKPCDRPHFYLSDKPKDPKEKALMVTDYPKQDPKTKQKLQLEVGAQYYVIGSFSRTSGTGFSNSDGLVVFQEMNKVGEAEE